MLIIPRYRNILLYRVHFWGRVTLIIHLEVNLPRFKLSMGIPLVMDMWWDSLFWHEKKALAAILWNFPHSERENSTACSYSPVNWSVRTGLVSPKHEGTEDNPRQSENHKKNLSLPWKLRLSIMKSPTLSSLFFS